MIDLHVHSTASDGCESPSELIEKATEVGICALSLTDHDSVNGLAEADHAAYQRSLCFIPGIEITTDYQETELHLLGYFIDYHNPKLIQACIEIHQGRRERAKEILYYLAQDGYVLSWDEVSKSADGFVGRSNIIHSLVEKGLVSPINRDQFFDEYLSKTGKAYVPHYYISPDKAIELVRESGGVPVLAHPGRMIGEWDIQEIIELGIAGIEVWYPAHSPREVAAYLEMARRYSLIPTGGSDYHGRGAQRLGIQEVPVQTVELLKESSR